MKFNEMQAFGEKPKEFPGPRSVPLAGGAGYSLTRALNYGTGSGSDLAVATDSTAFSLHRFGGLLMMPPL